MAKWIPALTMAFSLALTLPAAGRTWTDATGSRQVEADFVALQGELVWLCLAEDGDVQSVALKDLSRADQEVAGTLARRQAAQREAAARNDPNRVPYGPARKLCELASPGIRESSGIAPSRLRPGYFWTHNDSGDEARVYLFDLKGRDLGSCLLKGVLAFDWEDIASFRWEGKSYLLLCDTGNNVLNSGVQILYLIEEPPLDPEKGVSERVVPVVQTIHLSYEDRYRDCEAVAVDPRDRTILLVTKDRGLKCEVYALPWPEPNPDKAFVARQIATLGIPPATAADVSPDARRAIVLSYAHAYQYVRGEREDWAKAFARAPQEIAMPVRRQGESICYGSDGKTLYLTSEKRPCPLWEVPVLGPH